MKKHICWTIISMALAASSYQSLAQGTAFTYQGRLGVGTNVANGIYDLKFSVYDAANGVNLVAGPLTNSAVATSNGLFTATLDFGAGVFTGADRWLKISARTNGIAAFADLSPLQKVTPTPYAVTAGGLNGPLPAGQLAGTYGSVLNFNNAGNSFSGNGAGLAGVNATTLGGLGAGSFWKVSGNGGTTPGANFVGTTDNQPLELKVNGQRALRLEPAGGSPNVIGGSSANYVTNSVGVTIAGGGGNTVQTFSGSPGADANFASIGGGATNVIESGAGSAIGGGGWNAVQFSIFSGSANYSVIGGGSGNTIRGDSFSTIGGGNANGIYAANAVNGYSTIGGGQANGISGLGLTSVGATIGGGLTNAITSPLGTIAGGVNNLIAGDDLIGHSSVCSIGGGAGNFIGQQSSGGTIGGGVGNRVAEFTGVATIAGGEANDVANHAQYATIGGGQSNNVSAPYGSIAGGANNGTETAYSAIGGGGGNSVVWGDYGTIAGGYGNVLGFNGAFTLSAYSAIGGGATNSIIGANYAAISGGGGNRIFETGDFTTISGGQANNIDSSSAPGSSPYATIGGGTSNAIIHSSRATVAGGANNTIVGSDFLGSVFAGVIGGGSGNSLAAAAHSSVIGGGTSNLISIYSSNGTIGGGLENTVGSLCIGAAIGGGASNQSAAAYGTVPGGLQAVARNFGQQAYASGQFANVGDAQTSVFVCRRTTANATLTELFLDGSTQRMTIPTNSTWAFDVMVSGRASNGNSAAYQIRGVIKNNGGTTTIVGAPTFTLLAEDVAGWDASVAADNANQALTVKVNGSAGTSMRWVATVRTTEVSF